jgi:hypothetical protein
MKFIRTLIVSMLLLIQQAAFGVNVGGREVSIQDWDNMSASERQSALRIYNNLNGTSLSESQLRSEIQTQAGNVDQGQVDNAVNNANNSTNTSGVDPNSQEVRNVIDDPANADLSQIQENGNFTQEQINAQNAAQQEIANNRQNINRISNEVNSANENITNTQNSINNINNSQTQLNEQANNLQTQLQNTGDQIANLERLANDANSSGDIQEAQRIEDQLAAQRASQTSAQNQLNQVNSDKAKLQRDLDAANTRLAEQERERQLKQGELQAAQARETELTNGLLSEITEDAAENGIPENVTQTLEENGVDTENLEENLKNVDTSNLENLSTDDREQILNTIEQETENGNISLNEDGTVNVDTDAIVANQNNVRPDGICMEDSGVCISNERSVELLTCQTKPEAEKKSCEQDVARGVTKDYVEGGEGCKKSKVTQAVECREAGRTYNCEFNQCLSDEQVNELADKGAGCLDKENEAERDACFKGVKDEAVVNAAKGEYCLKDSAEAKACEESGKHWNCNMDFCADDIQNETIGNAVLDCQNKPNQNEKHHCMEELKANGAYLLASACEEAASPKGVACAEGGNVWNCGANACVTQDMNGRLVGAYQRCQGLPDGEKEKCMAELDKLAAAASEGEALTEDDLKSPGSPASVGFAVVAALGILGAQLVSAAAGFCYAMLTNVMASGMGIMNEKNTEKMADAEMNRLRTEFKKIEKKMESDVVSFEVQVEAINFYIMALDSGIRIGNAYADSYDSTGNMFGVAAGIAAIEAVIYALPPAPNWPGVTCAGIQAGFAAVGMGLASKASGIARKMVGQLEDQKAKLERIKKLFDKHFGQAGGLTQYAMNSAFNRGIQGIGGNGRISSAAGGGQGIKTEGRDPESAGCVNKEGSFEETCACRTSNSCLSISSPPILAETKIGRSLSKSLNIQETFDEANAITSGELSTTNLNSDSLAARFKRTKKVTKKLFDQINKKHKNNLKKGNVEITYPNDKMLAAYINKVVSPNDRIGGASKFMGKFMGDVDIKDIEDTEKQLGSNFTEDGRAVATQTKGTIQTKFGKFEIPKIEEYSGEELDLLAKQKDQGIVNSEFNGDLDKLKDLPDVHENTTKSLWNILTKRYHVITRQKRIGKFKKASAR